jgi:hypothetical protein
MIFQIGRKGTGKKLCDLLLKIAAIFKVLGRTSMHQKERTASIFEFEKLCKQTSVNFYQTTWCHIPEGTLYISYCLIHFLFTKPKIADD